MLLNAHETLFLPVFSAPHSLIHCFLPPSMLTNHGRWVAPMLAVRRQVRRPAELRGGVHGHEVVRRAAWPPGPAELVRPGRGGEHGRAERVGGGPVVAHAPGVRGVVGHHARPVRSRTYPPATLVGGDSGEFRADRPTEKSGDRSQEGRAWLRTMAGAKASRHCCRSFVTARFTRPLFQMVSQTFLPPQIALLGSGLRGLAAPLHGESLATMRTLFVMAWP